MKFTVYKAIILSSFTASLICSPLVNAIETNVTNTHITTIEANSETKVMELVNSFLGTIDYKDNKELAFEKIKLASTAEDTLPKALLSLMYLTSARDKKLN